MHRVVTVTGRNVAMFELSVACEVFGIARPEIDGWNYEHLVCSQFDEVHAGQGGVVLTPPRRLDAVAEADTVVIPAWFAVHHPPWAHPDGPADPLPEATVAAVRAAFDRGARVVSFCTGAFLLAEAGILDGRAATTHWMYTDALADRYPTVAVDPNVLYVDDDPVFTAAGTASGIDVCLHLVRRDLGADAANAVARRMVVPPHRDGGQAQFISAPVPTAAEGDPLQDLYGWIATHLDHPMTVDDLAARVAMSPRTFARRFGGATSESPLRWITTQRLGLARRLLETTDLPVEEVARRCGYGTAAGLRGPFQREVGLAPTTYRRRFERVPAT